MAETERPIHRKPAPLRALAFGFAIIILVGTVLLMLPVASVERVWTPPLTALFTATSATCVTGLVVVDTATYFSLFGQIVILLLIQIGGLGIMTIIGWVLMLFRRRINLRERTFLMEQVSSMQLGGVVRLVKHILICTGIFESIGAVLLSLRFVPLLGFWRGVWYGVFHAVSAFCNAGFDLMGTVTAPYASLVAFVDDPLVSIVIMALIVIGGLGFIVWDDLIENKLRFSRYRLHTKLVLVATAVLVFGGAVVFALVEWGNTLAPLSWKGKILSALFQVVTPRTAGFNTLDIAALTPAGKGLTIFLMFIGAGAGSTAGGIKMTTFVTLVLTAIYYTRGRSDVSVFGRRLEDTAVRRSFSATMIYLSVTILGTFVLLLQGLDMTDVLLETFSATSTVGLSTGITRALNPLSRVAIILLMYSGRLGSLSVMMAMTERRMAAVALKPSEKIMIG